MTLLLASCAAPITAHAGEPAPAGGSEVVAPTSAATGAEPGPGAAPPADPWRVHAPVPRRGAATAQIVRPVAALDRPAGREVGRLRTATRWAGQPQTLLVLGSAVHEGRRWVRVLLPGRPNGGSAWIARDAVVLHATRYWIDVALRRRSLTLWRNGRRIARYRVVVGAPRTRTPVGLAAVFERNRQRDPRSFVGAWVLSLTAHSDTWRRFDGGPGRIALHGRAGASLRDPLGTARSNGCIRVPERGIRRIARLVPVGTPVRVTP